MDASPKRRPALIRRARHARTRLGGRSAGVLAAALLLAAVAVVLLVSASSGGGARAPRGGAAGASRSAAAPQSAPGSSLQQPYGRPVSVSVALRPRGATVGPRFLGLSFETSALPALAADATRGNLVALLRSLGPGTLRLGGVSVDKGAAWLEGGKLPSWASFAITPQQLAALSTLAARSGWRVLLTVNLARDDPDEAAREAAAARRLLGARLAGIAIGNEPDRFQVEGLRGSSWSFSAYRTQFNAYRRAIQHAAPGVAIAGPDTSSGEPVLPWLRASAALGPDLLTEHYYPLNACGGHVPTVAELMSASMHERESAMLGELAEIQHASRIPLALDETNNIVCKGQAGVSNVFASALWAADYLPRALAAGIPSLDFHDLLSDPDAYSPLLGTGAQLHAAPEWYALLLASRLRGAAAVPAGVDGTPELTAHAFVRPSGAIQLVLVNFDAVGQTPLLVRLRLPAAFSAGSVLALSAPSLTSTAHVTLGGGAVAPSGAWSAKVPVPRLEHRAGSLELSLPASSAALITLTPAHARAPASARSTRTGAPPAR